MFQLPTACLMYQGEKKGGGLKVWLEIIVGEVKARSTKPHHWYSGQGLRRYTGFKEKMARQYVRIWEDEMEYMRDEEFPSFF